MSLVSTDELLAQVLRLPRHERARVAEELLSSLEEADESEVAAAWANELERRSSEIAEGKVQPVEWKTAQPRFGTSSSSVVRVALHPEARAELRAAAV